MKCISLEQLKGMSYKDKCKLMRDIINRKVEVKDGKNQQ
jgi:hypothetical protein